ncbi:p-nitrobenzoate reductase [Streptococcus gallolyticus subsp. gallolyticus ATCC BAA-2069]|nr:p-nitrobenzoate reductase [Streptococcus gallolyticus subsp. gallolyticus ATCC BAA-2069]
MLAAAERGLASLPAYEFIRFPKEIRKQLEIPEEESLLMGIALGYASDKPLNDLRTTRNPLDDILKISD